MIASKDVDTRCVINAHCVQNQVSQSTKSSDSEIRTYISFLIATNKRQRKREEESSAGLVQSSRDYKSHRMRRNSWTIPYKCIQACFQLNSINYS